MANSRGDLLLNSIPNEGVCLVVGAGDATGGAIARRFPREGYMTCVTRRSSDKLAPLVAQDGILNPDHVAEAYWMLHTQPRDAWTHELDLRPYMEKF